MCCRTDVRQKIEQIHLLKWFVKVVYGLIETINTEHNMHGAWNMKPHCTKSQSFVFILESFSQSYVRSGSTKNLICRNDTVRRRDGSAKIPPSSSLSLFPPCLCSAVMLMIHLALAHLVAISSPATHCGIVAAPQHLEVSQLKSATLAIFSESVESFFKFWL